MPLTWHVSVARRRPAGSAGRSLQRITRMAGPPRAGRTDVSTQIVSAHDYRSDELHCPGVSH